MNVGLVESAPFNSRHNKKIQQKEYSGVGSHLFAEVVKQSVENGFEGFISFKAKSSLIEYYQKELGAILINRKTRTMYIDEEGAKILYERYYASGK